MTTTMARPWAQFKSYLALNFTDRFEREAFFILMLGLVTYVYVALSSFDPFDPSLIAASFPQNPVENLAGEIGAQLSAVGFYFFGICSYLLPLPFLGTAFLILRKRRDAISIARCTGWGLSILCAIAICGSYLPEITFNQVRFSAGGIIGMKISAVSTSLFGPLGKIIVILTLASASVVLIGKRGLLEGLILPALPQFRFRLPKRKPKATAEEISFVHSEPAVSEPIRPILHEHFSSVPNEPDIPPFRLAEDYEPVNEAPRAALSDYTPPPVSMFRTSDSYGPLSALQKQEFESTAKVLTDTFEDFGIKGKVVAIQPGPVVTVFEFEPDAGTKIAKITGLADDLALALKVDSIIMHPVRGKRAIGVQVPNVDRDIVRLGDLLQSDAFKQSKSPLTLALGKSISGDPVCADLTKMPHLLMAGATGAGKSVAINGLLCSVIMKSSPDKVRMILVDPKMLELSVYEGIPHLLTPVITEPNRAALALKWATHEMERRYKLMQHARVRNLAGFNDLWQKSDESARQDLRDIVCDDNLGELPMILLVIDELADLMLTAPKDVEGNIQRLAQKARASGIHLVLATQRPSVDIITGVIKANLPCRAAFQVVSKHDSRTILDQIGADKLLGNGDMLIQRPGAARLERIQGAFITDEEVLGLVQRIKERSTTAYDETLISWIDQEASKLHDDPMGDTSSDDPKFDLAVDIAASQGAVSASYLQRQLKIGYNRAARMVEVMEAQGMVAKADGSKPRKWLGPSHEV